MAKMVTRTMVFATINCMTAEIANMKMEYKTFNFSGNLVKQEDILAEIKSNYETENFKILSVVMDSVKKETVLYGMTESDFLKYARPMESRTKIAETEESEGAEE